VRKLLTPSALLILVLFSTGCFHRWTEKEKKEFECTCEKTDTFQINPIEFVGFENNEFDSVLVKEFRDTILLDIFKIYVSKAEDPWGKEHKRRSGSANRTMHTKYLYEFVIPGYRSYILSDMKMIMWPQWSQTSENYGCVMGDFTLDGKQFHHCGNVCIEKRK
jgi:hypothetical protein